MAAFPFQAVIFDMDGVIVDTEAYYQKELGVFIEHLGIEVSEQERLGTVGGSRQSFQLLLADWYQRAGRGTYEPVVAEKMFNEWARTYAFNYADLLNPGVHETLDELKHLGVRTALASSSPVENIQRMLDECGLESCFESITSGDQFKQSKPAPDIYLHALSLLDLPAQACCCVEDSLPGITAGKRAGLTVVAKREDRFGFSQEDADVVIDTIPDLLGVGEQL